MLKIMPVFENYATFSLSVLYQKKKKKETMKSKLYICRQLGMKSSSFFIFRRFFRFIHVRTCIQWRNNHINFQLIEFKNVNEMQKKS